MWTHRIERSVTETATDSTRIATNWRTRLDSKQSALVERVLSGSLMRDWWDLTL